MTSSRYQQKVCEDLDNPLTCECDDYFGEEDVYCRSEVEPVYITMSIVDEYGQSKSLTCSYGWNGYRRIRQGEDLIEQLKDFMNVIDFRGLMKKYDIDFIV